MAKKILKAHLIRKKKFNFQTFQTLSEEYLRAVAYAFKAGATATAGAANKEKRLFLIYIFVSCKV